MRELEITTDRTAARPLRLRGGALLLAGLAALAACSAPSAPADPRAVDAPELLPPTCELSPEFSRVARAEFERQGLVGLSCAVVRDGRIVHLEHFGLEDRERAIPTGDATLYRWASISKTLTAVVAVQLATEGRLDLDRDVRQYVPEFPEQPWPITARQLLCHQGGIVHYSNGPVVALPPPAGVEHPYVDAVAALDTFKRSPLVHEPGTVFDYTTHGYMLLGAVCQRAAGIAYPELVEQRIARRLGLPTLAPDRAWEPSEHRTVGYRKDAQDQVVPSEQNDVSWKLAGGGFRSNVRDLARYAQGLLAGELLDAGQRAAAWTAQPTRDGRPTEYGLGFRLATRHGARIVMHTGSQEQTRTRMALVPERGWAVVVMCNSEWADLAPVGNGLLDVLFGPTPAAGGG